MNIAELTPRQGNVNILVEVVEVGVPREFVKFGKPGRVATAKVRDESGQITMTLWNEQIDLVKQGSRIRIVNGYVGEWQGEKQLTTGRMGSIEIVDEKDTKEEKEKTADQGKSEEKEEALEEDIEEDLEDEDEEKEGEEE